MDDAHGFHCSNIYATGTISDGCGYEAIRQLRRGFCTIYSASLHPQ